VQALANRVEELHKKVDTLTNMVSDLLEQFNARVEKSGSQQRKVASHIRSAEQMLMGMPGVKNNPQAQQMMKSILGLAVPDTKPCEGEDG
jgi:hypothetical protein